MADENIATSRSELIKKARESCNRSLADDNTYSYHRASMGKSREDTVKLSENALKIKFIAIRTVIAAAILLSVILIDKFDVTYENFSSSQISELLQSNHLYDVAKGYIGKYIKKEEDSVNVMNDGDIKDKVEEENLDEGSEKNEEDMEDTSKGAADEDDSKTSEDDKTEENK